MEVIIIFNTKLRKYTLLSAEFDIEPSQVHILKTSTDSIPNCSEDGASYASLTSMRLAKKCCAKLLDRLRPFLEDKKNWIEAIRASWEKGISLQETLIEKNDENLDKTNR